MMQRLRISETSCCNEDGNDYDEGDLGLDTLGLEGLVRPFRMPKAYQKAFEKW